MDGREINVFLELSVWLVLARILGDRCSLPRLRQLCLRFVELSRTDAGESPDWIVGAVKRYLEAWERWAPRGFVCLPRSLAAKLLLERRGLPVRVYVGVSRSREGGLVAHAWAISRGVIVAGGRGHSGFTELLRF